MAGNTLAIQLTVGADGLVEGLKVAGKNVDGAAQQMRASFKDVGQAANEATAPIEEFVHHVRGMRKEAFLGNFMAKQLAEVGIASKDAAAQVTGLVSAFALGGGLGLAVEVVKTIAVAFHESGEEIKKANEKAEESVKKLKEQTDLLILSIRGVSEAEKLRHTNIAPLEEQELAQKKALYQEYARLFGAQDRLNAAKKSGATGSDLALQQAAVDAEQERVDKAQSLLDITKEQIKAEKELISGVAGAQGAKDRKAAREQEALDNAKWREAEMQEWKKHYDAITSETLKAMQDADKAEEQHSVNVIEASFKATKALEKHAVELAKVREDEIRRVDAEETRSAQNQINAAQQIGAAMGALFADIGAGAKKARAGFVDLARAVIAAATKAVEAYAASSAAAAFFAEAGIPIIGPILGAAAAAAAGGLVLGLLSRIPSAAVGMPHVAADGPVYVHKNEAILTTSQAADWRAGEGGGGGGTHLHMHVGAGSIVDGEWWDRHEGNIVRKIQDATRKGRLAR